MNVIDDSSQIVSRVSVSAQYIKDLSFESPDAPNSLIPLADIPRIEIALEVKCVSLAEKNFYEVELHIEATAKAETRDTNQNVTLFVIELQYAGIFNVANIPEEDHQYVLAVECAAMLFPFARAIVATTTQDGGFQPLYIDPIDFSALYNKKISENQNYS